LLTVARPRGVEVELVTRRATRVGPVELPSADVRRAVAAELVGRELTDAGCAAAAVAVGGFVVVTDSPVAARLRLSAERARCSDGRRVPG
jgi:hypothetical protein